MYDRRTELGNLADKEDVSDAEVKTRAKEVGKSSRTLWTWLSAFRVDGLSGLVPKKRSDAGSYHNISSDVIDLVRAIRLTNPDWSTRAVLEEAERKLAKLGASPPSMWQVRRICQDISPAVKALADKRVNEFRNRYRFTYPREHSGVSYQIDHNRVDVLVCDMRQPKYRAASGEVRPWLTVVIDAASRRVIAFKFSYDPPNRHTVAGAIRISLLAKRGAYQTRYRSTMAKTWCRLTSLNLSRHLILTFLSAILMNHSSAESSRGSLARSIPAYGQHFLATWPPTPPSVILQRKLSSR